MSKFTPTKRYSALKKLRQAAALLDEARVLCFAKPDLAERLGAHAKAVNAQADGLEIGSSKKP